MCRYGFFELIYFCCKEPESEQKVLIPCQSCYRRFHSSCLNYPKEVEQKILSKSTWVCRECKACEICRDAGLPRTMVHCSLCQDAYHCFCLTPALPTPPSAGVWSCTTCSSTSKAGQKTPSKSSRKRSSGVGSKQRFPNECNTCGDSFSIPVKGNKEEKAKVSLISLLSAPISSNLPLTSFLSFFFIFAISSVPANVPQRGLHCLL